MSQPSASAAFRFSASLGLVAVAAGAFGAHALKSFLVQSGTVEIWEKAVFYHLIHSLLMTALSTWRPFPRAAWVAFGLGVLGFSGSLYFYSLLHAVWLMYITPFGGLSLLIGWLLLALRRAVPSAEGG